MECVLSDQDSVVVLPTGGGKSLCYQAPAVVGGGLAVVVSPLISLMKDQVDGLQACGVPAACVNSSHSPDHRRRIAEQVRSGQLRLLYVSPERLVSHRMLEFLSGVAISFFVVDEAHCISSWGHDFRPEYRGLRVLRERFPQHSIHAYTATASQQVRSDIAQQLGLRDSTRSSADMPVKLELCTASAGPTSNELRPRYSNVAGGPLPTTRDWRMNCASGIKTISSPNEWM
jgi:ATP-dependent DNA helicase RecQ